MEMTKSPSYESKSVLGEIYDQAQEFNLNTPAIPGELSKTCIQASAAFSFARDNESILVLHSVKLIESGLGRFHIRGDMVV